MLSAYVQYLLSPNTSFGPGVERELKEELSHFTNKSTIHNFKGAGYTIPLWYRTCFVTKLQQHTLN